MTTTNNLSNGNSAKMTKITKAKKGYLIRMASISLCLFLLGAVLLILAFKEGKEPDISSLTTTVKTMLNIATITFIIIAFILFDAKRLITKYHKVKNILNN